MPKLIAIQADPLGALVPESDTTLKISQEAQKRGARLFAYQPEHLAYDHHQICCQGSFFTLNSESRIDSLSPLANINLGEADFVLIRQNPPVNSLYLTNTYLLELLANHTKVLNNPRGLRNLSEKLFTLNFPDLIPPTLVSSDRHQQLEFMNRYQQVIVKPLYDYGGRGVIYLQAGDFNTDSLLDLYAEHYAEPLMMQQYIPQVKQGDKRILMIDGNPIGAYVRQPPVQQIRSNLRVGGKALPTDLTARDLHICQTLAPFLKENGIYLAGLDVIGPYLTEVNVTSPTGFITLQQLYKVDAAKIFWDGLGV